MSAEIVQLRDYQNPKDIERLYAGDGGALLIDTAPSETVPFGGAGIDGMTFTAPERDPA